MDKFIDNFTQFWYLYLILFFFIVLTLFVCKKAFAAAAAHSKKTNALIAKAKREKELYETFKDADSTLIASSEADSLFEGIAITLEQECQKASNPDSFFTKLTEEQKKVYAFYYLAKDVKNEKLSAFFSSSTSPLTDYAVHATDDILGSKAKEIVKSMFDCYDETNEEASVIPETTDKLDCDFADCVHNISLFEKGGEFIKANADSFAK